MTGYRNDQGAILNRSALPDATYVTITTISTTVEWQGCSATATVYKGGPEPVGHSKENPVFPHCSLTSSYMGLPASAMTPEVLVKTVPACD